RPRMVRASVDLPEPDSPTTARISPSPMAKLMPSSAATEPKCLVSASTLSTGLMMSGDIDQLLGKVAAAVAARMDGSQLWRLGGTTGLGARAARCEGATRK